MKKYISQGLVSTTLIKYQQRKNALKLSWKISHIKAMFKTIWRLASYLSQWTLMMECHPCVLSMDQSAWRLSNRKRWHALLVWLARCLQVGMTHREYHERNNEYGRVEHLCSCCCKRCQAAITSCYQTYTMSRSLCLQITCHSLVSAETGISIYKILVNI
jgi:hypothetical protein